MLSLNVRNVEIESLNFLFRLALGWTPTVERNESDNLMRIKLYKTNFLDGYVPIIFLGFFLLKQCSIKHLNALWLHIFIWL